MKTNSLKTTLSALTAAVIFFSQAPNALAQDGQYHQQGDWRVSAGAGVLVIPEYVGSDEVQILPIPVIDVTYKDRVFLNFYDGLGGYLYKSDGLNVKTSLGFEFGREEDDDQSLAGTGDIDDAATLNLEASYHIGQFSPFVSIKQYLGGTEGLQGEIGVESFFSLGEDLWTDPTIKLGVSAEYSDEDHMEGYFGVNSQQSLRSGIARYTPEAGFSAAKAEFSFIYPFTEEWTATTMVEYSQIIGDAADSPLVEEENQFGGGVFISYNF